MTDITDKDRRAARVWAKNWQGDQDDDTSAAARVILATVDATAPTLAEELRHIAEHWKEWTTKTITAALAAATDRAKHMEHDLAEARAEVERVTRERERSLAQVQGLARRESDLTSEVRMLTDERDEALAEVERLAADNEELRRTDNYREFREFLGVQKGAESNAESLDPADVPAGEPWLIRTKGREALAVRDGDPFWPWSATYLNGGIDDVTDESVTLVTRLVPAPRVITDPDELEQLAATSIIRDGRGWPGGITDQGVTMINGFCVSDEEVLGHGPVTVLWEPEA